MIRCVGCLSSVRAIVARFAHCHILVKYCGRSSSLVYKTGSSLHRSFCNNVRHKPWLHPSPRLDILLLLGVF